MTFLFLKVWFCLLLQYIRESWFLKWHCLLRTDHKASLFSSSITSCSSITFKVDCMNYVCMGILDHSGSVFSRYTQGRISVKVEMAPPWTFLQKSPSLENNNLLLWVLRVWSDSSQVLQWCCGCPAWLIAQAAGEVCKCVCVCVCMCMKRRLMT